MLIWHSNYYQALQDTRVCLKQSNYTQVPQLSVGEEFDMEQPLIIQIDDLSIQELKRTLDLIIQMRLYTSQAIVFMSPDKKIMHRRMISIISDAKDHTRGSYTCNNRHRLERKAIILMENRRNLIFCTPTMNIVSLELQTHFSP